MSGMQIKDGTGSGYAAGVKADNRLQTSSVSISKLAHVSEEDGLAFSWTSTNYDYDAGDTILLIKNTGTRHLHIQRAIFYSDTATMVVGHRPTATVTTPTGTATAGVNMNGTSNNAADATAITDESTNVQGAVLLNLYVPAGIPVQSDNEGAVILAQNQSFGFDFVTAGAAATITVLGYFEDPA